LSIIKHVTLQQIVAHDFQYDPHILELEINKINLKNCEKETDNYSTEEGTLSVNINDTIINNPKLTANFLNTS
jgi:hypothetical protein